MWGARKSMYLVSNVEANEYNKKQCSVCSNVSFICVLPRFLHNCPMCFWTFHQGHSWEQACGVLEKVRKEYCTRLSLVHVRVPDNCGDEGLVGLGEPEVMSCASNLAEGGGKCWFSALFYLLVGKKCG